MRPTTNPPHPNNEFGIGYFILDTRNRLAYDELMATIVVIGILGYALDAAARVGYRLWTRDPASS